MMAAYYRDVDTDAVPPPAVKSLRSKFENLALDMTGGRPPNVHDHLDPNHPRPRAVSSSNTDQPNGSRHLRSSSSSSDLKSGTKRPPPPPPPRGLKAGPPPSPLPSPLFRPVPIPAVLSSTSNGPLSASFSPVSSVSDSDAHLSPASGNVASLRTKFSNPSLDPPSRPHTPKQSVSGLYPAWPPDEQPPHPSPPAIPPRPVMNTIATTATTRTSPRLRTQKQGNHSTKIAAPTISPSLSYDGGDSDIDFSEPVVVPPELPSRTPKVTTAQIDVHQKENSCDIDTDSSPDSNEGSGSRIRSPFQPVKAPRPGVPPPPRPPLRSQVPAPSVSPSSHSSPPPLPSRRAMAAAPVEPHLAPRHPLRPHITSNTSSPVDPPTSPVISGKLLGNSKLPPPPTRTIALGDKLPPARRPPTPSSDEESGDEDDSKSRLTEGLPDGSRSSRRPPVLPIHPFTEQKIHVPAYTGHVVVSGEHVIVASQNNVKVYDLLQSDVPLYSLQAKDVGLKDLKVTSMAFRPTAKPADDGCFLWLGTKDGHLLELDVRAACIVGTKLVAHSQSVSHIIRHGRSMITIDQGGKTLIFIPEGTDDLWLSVAQPRVIRIAEKQEFAKILGGLLWTSARSDMNGGGTSLGKLPTVRVYDVLSPGNLNRSLFPTDNVGAVTSGTILPTQPDRVYLGHEGGFISIWAIDAGDGFPQCIEVMKVSVSDVLSLEGVNERLWAGGRKGTISAYDVTSRPWVITNCWMAHNELPVLRLTVDHIGIRKTGRLRVVSVGRDEQIRFWDGLLGSNWIDRELLKQEGSFSTFRELSVLLISWNVDAARPESLNDDAANAAFIQHALSSVDSPDIIAFGLQEVVDLENRKLTAKHVLLGSKKKEDSGISEKVTTGYKKWHDYFLLAVRLAMPPDVLYTVTHTENLVGLFSCVMVKHSKRMALQDVAVATIKRGMGGRYGNKGAIMSRLVIEDSSICFVNCHLAAGQHHVRQRNADVAAILEETAFPVTRTGEVAYAGGGDGSMILDHEIVFVSGDMNYRIDVRRDNIIASVEAGDYDSLIPFDQLTKEMKNNRGFRFRQFTEGRLTFAPTYKYDRRSGEYDSSEKSRAPAWCDRVLWRSSVGSRVRQINYERYEANVSDHRPISAGFKVTIKSISGEVRARVKMEVGLRWVEEQERLLAGAEVFYERQGMM